MTRVNDRFIACSDIDSRPPDQDINSVFIEFTPEDDRSRFQPAFYNRFALDIVTETVFDYPYACITEKTLRPLACRRMFVLVAPSGVLSLLKSQGFVSFDNLLDETYDSIQEPQKRFLAVMATIRQFCSLPMDHIRAYMKENYWRLEQNFQVLKHLKQHQLAQLRQQLSQEKK